VFKNWLEIFKTCTAGSGHKWGAGVVPAAWIAKSVSLQCTTIHPNKRRSSAEIMNEFCCLWLLPISPTITYSVWTDSLDRCQSFFCGPISGHCVIIKISYIPFQCSASVGDPEHAHIGRYWWTRISSAHTFH